ncbi:MAG: hypothetical protein JKX78_13095 [Alteromonadaceae bacterium]|nr:hypothetical protein [Alteromonadaceae bacterium]
MFINKQLLSIVVLGALSLNVTLFSNKVVAAEKESVTKRQSVKVPAMRNRVYAQLARAQKLADDGDKIAGFDVLDDVKDSIDSLNSYEKAMLWNFYGFMYYANDDIDNAIDSFQQLIALQAIPQSLYLSTLYSLTQLAMQQQHYSQALAFLQQWKANNAKKITASQQILFAQIYYQTKQYKQSVTYINSAILMVESKNKIAKENWLVLQRADYYALKQPKQVTKVLEKLVRLYDKAQYWLQLSAMYGEIGQEDKQLAVMEAAYQAGYVTKSNDITSLAQMYLYHGAPYKSAALLDEALAKGTVKAEQKYLNLLAQSYLAAKEPAKAIPVLQQVSKIVDTGKFDAQLAQTYLNMEQWQQAIKFAEKAIQRGGFGQLGTTYLVQGMAHFNLQQFEPALTAFTHAEKINNSKKMAQQWRKYVVREQGYQQRLAQVKLAQQENSENL